MKRVMKGILYYSSGIKIQDGVARANRGEGRDALRSRFPSFVSLLYTFLPSAIGIRRKRLYAVTFQEHFLASTYACPREISRRNAREEQDGQEGVAGLGNTEPRTRLSGSEHRNACGLTSIICVRRISERGAGSLNSGRT